MPKLLEEIKNRVYLGSKKCLDTRGRNKRKTSFVYNALFYSMYLYLALSNGVRESNRFIIFNWLFPGN